MFHCGARAGGGSARRAERLGRCRPARLRETGPASERPGPPQSGPHLEERAGPRAPVREAVQFDVDAVALELAAHLAAGRGRYGSGVGRDKGKKGGATLVPSGSLSSPSPWKRCPWGKADAFHDYEQKPTQLPCLISNEEGVEDKAGRRAGEQTPCAERWPPDGLFAARSFRGGGKPGTARGTSRPRARRTWRAAAGARAWRVIRGARPWRRPPLSGGRGEGGERDAPRLRSGAGGCVLGGRRTLKLPLASVWRRPSFIMPS